MIEIQYIVVRHNEGGQYEMNIHVSNLKGTIAVEKNQTVTLKIKDKITSLPEISGICILCALLNSDSINDDDLLIFLKSHLPKSINVQRENISTDLVFHIGRNKRMIIFTKSRWKKIKISNEIHTGDPVNGKFLVGIYQSSNELPLGFLSSISVKMILPKNMFPAFIRLHTYKDDSSQTIQWATNHRRIYKLLDYPRCVLSKLCPNMPAEMASFWAHKFMSLLAVLYVSHNQFEYEISLANKTRTENGEELVATLNWKEGTFISNKKYSNCDKFVLLQEIEEPHLMTRWGLPFLCSVVGKSGKSYYSSNEIKKLNENVFSRDGVSFITKILTCIDWYVSDNGSKENLPKDQSDQHEFLKRIYFKIFNRPVFTICDHERSLAEKLCDLACVYGNHLHLHYAQKTTQGAFIPFLQPVEMFAELFMSDLTNGQDMVSNGFFHHMKNILFTIHNNEFCLKNEI